MDTETKPIQSISSLFQGYEIKYLEKSHRTERGDLLTDFLKHLNPPRQIAGMKPLSFPFISRYFSERKMSNAQIYQFFKDCERAKNFSSFFWWAGKVQKDGKGI